MDASTLILKFNDIIGKSVNEKIVLLKQPGVVEWLTDENQFIAFLDSIYPELLLLSEQKTLKGKNLPKSKIREEYKKKEDEWGQNTLSTKRPDLLKHGQWTTKLGEHSLEELQILLGKTPTSPINKNGYKPDCEVEDAIWEAKAQTYFTDGTAGEKILGVPFKYADVPELYGKPLKILCMGCAEKLSREHYGNLSGEKCTEKKNKFIDFYKEMGIEWVGATELIKEIISNF